MKKDSFYSLANSINDLLKDSKANFNMVGELLKPYERQDYINMLNKLLDEVVLHEKLPKVSEQHMYVIRQTHISLVLRLLGKVEHFDGLSASDYDAYLINLGEEAIEIPRLKCQINKDDLAIRPGSLQETTPLVIQPNECCFQPALDSILLLHLCHSPTPVMIFRSASQFDTTWEFNLTTLKPVRRVATDLQSSRIQVALMVMDKMKLTGTSVIAMLQALSRSRQADFMRWDAAKLLYKLDKQKGAVIVDELSRDTSSRSLQRAALATKEKIIGGSHD